MLLLFSHSVVSDSSWPHGLKPARLLCPWDSPGKNIEVSYHFLPQRTFLTQGLNPCLLFTRQILYHWATWEAWEEFWKQHNLGTWSTFQTPRKFMYSGKEGGYTDDHRAGTTWSILSDPQVKKCLGGVLKWAYWKHIAVFGGLQPKDSMFHQLKHTRHWRTEHILTVLKSMIFTEWSFSKDILLFL